MNTDDCDLFVFGPIAAWGLVAVYFSLQMQRHGKRGPTWFSEQWRKESYTPNGQRWLRRLKIVVACAPLVPMVGIAASWVLCPEPLRRGHRVHSEAPALDFVRPIGLVWWIVFAYSIVGTYLLARLVRHGRDGRNPSIFSLLKSSSYSDEGQRWLVRFRIWLVVSLLVWPLVFLFGGGG